MYWAHCFLVFPQWTRLTNAPDVTQEHVYATVTATVWVSRGGALACQSHDAVWFVCFRLSITVVPSWNEIYDWNPYGSTLQMVCVEVFHCIPSRCTEEATWTAEEGEEAKYSDFA